MPTMAISTIAQPATPSGELAPASPLRPLYEASAEAMGVRWEQVALHMPDEIPEGLRRLVHRHNPHLAQAMGARARLQWVTDPTHELDLPRLENLDRQALGTLVKLGLLPMTPHYSIEASHQAGLTLSVLAFPQHAQISLDPDVALSFQFRPHHPVLFRWLTLFHEAGHARMRQLRAPMDFSDWSPEQVQAFQQWMWGPSGEEQGSLANRYAESYADAFAVFALLKAAGPTSAVRVTFEDLLKVRQRDQVVDEGKDSHATLATLQAIEEALQRSPQLWDVWSRASPDEMERLAAHYATEGWMRQWTKSVSEHVLANAFGHSKVVPEGVKFGQAEEAFFERQNAKLHAYLVRRLQAYVYAGPLADPQSPPTNNDPLLESLAKLDGLWAMQFHRRAGEAGCRWLRDYFERPAFGAGDQQVIEEAFENRPEVKEFQRSLMQAAASFFDQAAHEEEEKAYQDQQAQAMAEGVARSLRRRSWR